jgi:hypothetical protein
MVARRCLTLAIALCGALVATGAEAQKPIASGCTFVQGLCLGLATAKKATYSLWDGRPWIPPGIAIDVWGKATGPSPCGGTSIQVASWRPSKTIKCKR